MSVDHMKFSVSSKSMTPIRARLAPTNTSSSGSRCASSARMGRPLSGVQSGPAPQNSHIPLWCRPPATFRRRPHSRIVPRARVARLPLPWTRCRPSCSRFAMYSMPCGRGFLPSGPRMLPDDDLLVIHERVADVEIGVGMGRLGISQPSGARLGRVVKARIDIDLDHFTFRMVSMRARSGSGCRTIRRMYARR